MLASPRAITSLLSLAGFPPLVGFRLKWIALTRVAIRGVGVIFVIVSLAVRALYYINTFLGASLIARKGLISREGRGTVVLIIVNLLGLTVVIIT